MASVRHGHRLDDPRNPEILQRWFLICRGLSDSALSLVIPATLRALLRQPEVRERLLRKSVESRMSSTFNMKRLPPT